MRKFETRTIGKKDAIRLYQQAATEFEMSKVPMGTPASGMVEQWQRLTALEARRRALEVAEDQSEFVTVDLVYGKPKDVENFYNQLAGEPEV
ncbi:MAG: hypothetical protein GC165_01140 [Armatimonadetes bacterium]|nr:hypothetical protein [Armatimonadota bacterium]